MHQCQHIIVVHGIVALQDVLIVLEGQVEELLAWCGQLRIVPRHMPLALYSLQPLPVSVHSCSRRDVPWQASTQLEKSACLQWAGEGYKTGRAGCRRPVTCCIATLIALWVQCRMPAVLGRPGSSSLMQMESMC